MSRRDYSGGGLGLSQHYGRRLQQRFESRTTKATDCIRTAGCSANRITALACGGNRRGWACPVNGSFDGTSWSKLVRRVDAIVGQRLHQPDIKGPSVNADLKMTHAPVDRLGR